MKASKVFISYTHDSDSHMNRVFELSERLRSDGVDSSIDQYEVSPPEGWPAWMRRQIKQADFVLVICSENYLKRYERSEELGKGAGAKWEGGIIGQELYEAEGRNTKFIPVVFAPDDVKHIPVEMRGGTHYVLDSDARYEDLYGHLTEQPKTVKRELGELRQLPPIGTQRTVSPRLVDAAQEPSPVVPHESVKSQHPLVALVQPGGTTLFVRAQRIRARGKLVSLSILPSDPRQISAITELERNSREPIGIAYNLTALFVRLKSIEQIIEKEEVWNLEFEEDEYATRGGAFEFSMVGYSPDQIAEMRAAESCLMKS
jgi:TIR domain